MIASPRALRPAGARRPKADAPSLREAASAARPLSEVCHGLCQCVYLGADAIPCPLSVSRSPSLCQSLGVSLSLSLPPRVCLRARVCLSVCLSASASRRLGSVSLNLHLFLSLSLLTPGLPRVLWLWPWLPRWRRPAVSRGVGACECLCVCPCACMSFVCSLRKVLCLEGGVGARGASGGRRGGADELLVHRAGGSRWLWAPGRCRAGWALRATAGLRTGPQEAQRTAGPSGPRSQRAPGPRGPEQRRPWWGGGGAMSRSACGTGSTSS